MKHIIEYLLQSVLFTGLALAPQFVLADGADTPDFVDGKQVYEHICQGCHMPDGMGAVGAGYYPAFAGNPNLASAQYTALVILMGRRNMPSFGKGNLVGEKTLFGMTLSDEEVASVANYIRSHFGNTFEDQLTAAEVKALRPR
jgi:mono/diheme cytochrome c family protein